jgi:hypothetical protein
LDGIIICSDQKHITGYSQFYQSKMFDIYKNDCQLIVAMGGHTDYGKMVVDILEEKLHLCSSYVEMKVLVHAATRKVFKERIASVFQARDTNRPQIEAIIAASYCKHEPNGEPQLWKVVDASVNRIRGFDCVGSGGDIARFWFKWLFPSKWETVLPMRIANPVASQVIEQAIAFNPESGGGYEIRGCPKPGVPYCGSPSMATSPVTREFQDLVQGIRALLIACLDIQIDEAELQNRVNFIRAAAIKIKKSDLDTDQQIREARKKPKMGK